MAGMIICINILILFDLLFIDGDSTNPNLSPLNLIALARRNVHSKLESRFVGTVSGECFSCLHLILTFGSYPKVAISKHFTVIQAETLIEAQSLI